MEQFKRRLNASTHPVKELIHFLRIFLLPNDQNNGMQLVFAVVFDGQKIDFLNALVDAFGDALMEVVQSVSETGELDKPDNLNKSNALTNQEELVTWLLSRNCDPVTYHVGTVWSSIPEIKNDRRLYLEISSFFDTNEGLAQLPPQEIKKRVEQMVDGRLPNVKWAASKKSWHRWLSSLRVLKFLDLSLVIMIFLSVPTVPAVLILIAMKGASLNLLWLIPVLAAILLAVTAALIRWLEFIEEDHQMWPDDSHLDCIVAHENSGVQNQMSLVAEVKPSFSRRIVIRIVLWIANAVSRHWYTRGSLVGIDTIHFARFFLIDGRKRMLFLSDYDGSWSRYLFDFTGVGALAVVPIWSSLKGCPKSRFLRWPAIGFEERFLPFTRCCQIEVLYNYSSYPQLSVSEIKRNEKIRTGLFKQSSDAEILAWLSLFGGGDRG